MSASGVAESSIEHSQSLYQQFRPSSSFKFPKRTFGTKGETRSFRSEWCLNYTWLHYDVSKDAAFCYLCMRAEHKKKFLASKKRDPAFTSRGFTYWKEATTAFEKHQGSASHREAVEALVLLPSQIQGDIGEMCDNKCADEKKANREMLMHILQNVRFLARQGLPLRGSSNDKESNFIQLLHLHNTGKSVDGWLSKKTNKYTSHDIQDELLGQMARKILIDIADNIRNGGFFSIMADECTDCSNKEQFTINLRWVDSKLQDHTEFIGLYAMDAIDANSLAFSIKDVLLRMNLPLSNCRGQCYDGASNMSGIRGGVSTQLTTIEKRALFTLCYCHALNLAISDTIKQSKICRTALEVAFEITKLVKFSPKRNAIFDRIRSEEEDGSSIGIRTFCSTRWTVRGDSIESILSNYDNLKQLWEECLETNLQPDVKGRVIGVQSQMVQFDLLFGLKLCQRILKITDNLSKTLQKSSLSAAEAQHVAALTVTTIRKMRSDEDFDLFFQLLLSMQKSKGTNPPKLPRKRKAPRRFSEGTGEAYHSPTVKEHYRRQYYEAIDSTIATIEKRFDQPGYVMYCNLEGLLIKAARQQDFSAEFQAVTDFYGDDLQASSLSAQLTTFGSQFTDSPDLVTLDDCLSYLQSLQIGAQSFFSEVCQVAKLLLVIPATNAFSKCSFLAMRRIKTYLRSTMGQERLNHLMLLHLHKEKLDDLDLVYIANEFVKGCEHRLSFFGKFK